MIIAIDGPSGSGKSTVASRLAKELDFIYIDTGAMFRAVTYLALDKRALDESAVSKLMEHISLGVVPGGIILNGQLLTTQLRSKQIDEHVSFYSTLPEVRTVLLNIQRELAKDNNVIMDGRDIGTTVFPNADFKFYLDASVDVRAKRRYDERQEGLSLQEVRDAVTVRDLKDSTRVHSPLKRADDAIIIDTSNLSVEEVICQIKNTITGS